jgi:biotin carboxyl carrier protein
MTDNLKKEEYSEFVLDGVTYKTLLSKKFTNKKKYERYDPKKIMAVIPGTVIKVNVRKGKRIEVGDNLVLFEAMKMQSYIQAHMDGKVKQVYVKKGQMISKGYLILELE